MSEKEIIELQTELGRLVFEIGLLEERKVAIVKEQNPLQQEANEIARQLKIMKKIEDDDKPDITNITR